MIDNNYMYKFIEDICNEVGPRESGTEQEILAGNRVESELKKFCDETHQHILVALMPFLEVLNMVQYWSLLLEFFIG
jgi:hypothetical protein